MAPRSELKRLLAALPKRGQGPPRALELEQAKGLPERPLAEGLELPGLTPWEAAQEAAQGAEPRRGVNPRLPLALKGQAQAVALEEVPLAPMAKVKLNNALAKARLGKRLSQAERKLLGRHNLKRIMAQLRAKEDEA